MNIVFDFGNVLVGWNPTQLIQQHYPRPAHSSHPPHTPESAAALADALINHQDWLDFDLGLLESEELATRSARRLALDDAAHLQAFVDRIPHMLPVFDETVALMQTLAEGGRDAGEVQGEHRVLYLSNMPASFADVLEVRCPWIARFEDGIFSGRVNLAKPDDAIYAAAEQRLRLNPAETLFLDDSAKNVAAAKARGWHSELITNPHNAKSVRDALVKHGVLRAA